MAGLVVVSVGFALAFDRVTQGLFRDDAFTSLHNSHREPQNRGCKRFHVSRRVLGLASSVVPVPVPLFWLGSLERARLSSALRSANETLRLENESYREATGQLTDQISSLQTSLTELSEQAEIDPATKAAIELLPALIRRGRPGRIVAPSRSPLRLRPRKARSAFCETCSARLNPG